MNTRFWSGKRVLITGHTGFKGSWLSLWLQSLGANVLGYALSPPSQPALFEVAGVEQDMISKIGDIRDLEKLRSVFQEFNPEIVFHLAAQSLVRYSYNNPVETYSTNVMGTVNLLEAARATSSVAALVMITSDKCYENQEWVWGYRENEPMGGFDPYSNSKGCAELVTAAYRKSFFQDQGPALASARAGNVIGGGDWALDRLIPDAISAFIEHRPVLIRNPHAIRPWQHVLEPLSGYMLLAEKLYQTGAEYAEAWNFGPEDHDAQPVNWIIDQLKLKWGDGASWNIDAGIHPHEAHYLKLDCSKAKARLGWYPTWNLSQSLEKIIEWHKLMQQGANMKSATLDQISAFMKEKTS
ncbi:CDP-glucose 4,6-dehydratase [Methylomonas sp. AM2-LC]|uniref:CDP-glucose 4,6-dehydratase n=1 Tax=Methylomonas sp. AM2-LC TaxID=3153301 RepID=UPI003267C822